MEELLVYAMLYCEGFDVEGLYQSKLDELFLENSEDELLLELEFLSGKMKESALYLRNYLAMHEFNTDAFGTALMRELQNQYEALELMEFSKYTYSLWSKLPEAIQHTQPFWTLCYADEPLSWGDEKQSRELYEGALNFYLSVEE